MVRGRRHAQGHARSAQRVRDGRRVVVRVRRARELRQQPPRARGEARPRDPRRGPGARGLHAPRPARGRRQHRHEQRGARRRVRARHGRPVGRHAVPPLPDVGAQHQATWLRVPVGQRLLGRGARHALARRALRPGDCAALHLVACSGRGRHPDQLPGAGEPQPARGPAGGPAGRDEVRLPDQPAAAEPARAAGRRQQHRALRVAQGRQAADAALRASAGGRRVVEGLDRALQAGAGADLGAHAQGPAQQEARLARRDLLPAEGSAREEQDLPGPREAADRRRGSAGLRLGVHHAATRGGPDSSGPPRSFPDRRCGLPHCAPLHRVGGSSQSPANFPGCRGASADSRFPIQDPKKSECPCRPASPRSSAGTSPTTPVC